MVGRRYGVVIHILKNEGNRFAQSAAIGGVSVGDILVGGFTGAAITRLFEFYWIVRTRTHSRTKSSSPFSYHPSNVE